MAVRAQGVRRDRQDGPDSGVSVLAPDTEEHAHHEGQRDELHQAFTISFAASTTPRNTSSDMETIVSACRKFTHGIVKL